MATVWVIFAVTLFFTQTSISSSQSAQCLQNCHRDNLTSLRKVDCDAWCHSRERRDLKVIDCVSLLVGNLVETESAEIGRPEELQVTHKSLEGEQTDGVRISWKPSNLGLAYLQGFQLTLQGGRGDFSRSRCVQLHLTQDNLTSQQKLMEEYHYDGFQNLVLEAEYLVAVQPLPLPKVSELQQDRVSTFTFHARECDYLLNKSLQECMEEWLPQTVKVNSSYSSAKVTFDLAPERYKFGSYFVHFGRPPHNYLEVDTWEPENTTSYIVQQPFDANATSLTYDLENLDPSAPYTVQISSNQQGAPRSTPVVFSVQHKPDPRGPTLSTPVIVAMACLGVLGLWAFAGLAAVLIYRRYRRRKNEYREFEDEEDGPGESMSLGGEGGQQQGGVRTGQRNNGEKSKDLLSPDYDCPKVLILYSPADCDAHTNTVNQFASFLHESCRCHVFLDSWYVGEGDLHVQAEWTIKHLTDCDYVIVVCSTGLKYHLQRQRHNSSSTTAVDPQPNEMFLYAVNMAAERLRHDRAVANGRPCRFVTAYFEYTYESDIPGSLELAPKFKVMSEFHLLFCHLHGLEVNCRKYSRLIKDLEQEGHLQTETGQSLDSAIKATRKYFTDNPDWFAQKCAESAQRSAGQGSTPPGQRLESTVQGETPAGEGSSPQTTVDIHSPEIHRNGSHKKVANVPKDATDGNPVVMEMQPYPSQHPPKKKTDAELIEEEEDQALVDSELNLDGIARPAQRWHTKLAPSYLHMNPDDSHMFPLSVATLPAPVPLLKTHPARTASLPPNYRLLGASPGLMSVELKPIADAKRLGDNSFLFRLDSGVDLTYHSGSSGDEANTPTDTTC
ncbi:interleukin-17 receptor D-like [Branchiostoma floridae]|uniref:Interleukin-17 receptor D n=1 Tax=Branchiostoma floridae TaxID=7739 RepID=A0A9J7L7V2_BRAFL|nr:interleukin-17 receptor D-like [Branchiostoma floridae]